MTLAEQVHLVASTYLQHSPLPVRTVSWRSLGETRALGLFLDGKASFTLARADRALLWFSENWPAGLDWPAEVRRPPSSAAAPAEDAPAAAASPDGAAGAPLPSEALA